MTHFTNRHISILASPNSSHFTRIPTYQPHHENTHISATSREYPHISLITRIPTYQPHHISENTHISASAHHQKTHINTTTIMLHSPFMHYSLIQLLLHHKSTPPPQNQYHCNLNLLPPIPKMFNSVIFI